MTIKTETQQPEITMTADQQSKLMALQSADNATDAEKVRARALLNFHSGLAKNKSCLLVGERDENGFTPSYKPLAYATFQRVLEDWNNGKGMAALKSKRAGGAGGSKSRFDSAELRSFLQVTLPTAPPKTMRRFGKSDEEQEYQPSSWSVTDLCDKWNEQNPDNTLTSQTLTRHLKQMCDDEAQARRNALMEQAVKQAADNGYVLGNFEQSPDNNDLYVATCEQSGKAAYICYPTSQTCPLEMFGDALESAVPDAIEQPDATEPTADVVELKEEAESVVEESVTEPEEKPKAPKKPKKAAQKKEAPKEVKK